MDAQENFDEIAEHLKQYAPPAVYKYRTWTDENHRALIKNGVVWFSHPFELNDPLDVRPEAIFNILELQDQRFFDKLLATAKLNNPHLTTEAELRTAAEEQFHFLNLNPDVILQNWNNYNLVRENFDQYGVFSTAMNPLSKGLWERYGDDYQGYCLGFDTVELCRGIKSGYGYVSYSDDPFQYSFIEDMVRTDLDRLYLKKTDWGYEEEFRFITLGIGHYSERLQGFKNTAVKELILGHNSTPYEDEIKDLFKARFGDLPVYKTIIHKNETISKEQIG